jgi:DNA polymerase-3 subunit gamma/tau
MLGLADRTQIFTLFDLLMKGDAKAALENLERQHSAGADPQVVLRDLMELCHWLTRLKVVPDAGDDASVPEAERRQGGEMAAALSMPVLARTWQMLLKGMDETQTAPRPLMAVEMVLIRLCHMASLPTPEEAIKSLGSTPQASTGSPTTTPASSESPSPSSRTQGGGTGGGATGAGDHPHAPMMAAQAAMPDDDPHETPEALASEVPAEPETSGINSLAQIVAMADDAREPILAAWLRNDVRPIRITPGQIEISGEGNPPKDLLTKLRECLFKWTDQRWLVVISDAPGARTLAELDAEAEAEARRQVAQDPVVSQILEMFPGAEVRNVRARHDQPSGEDET